MPYPFELYYGKFPHTPLLDFHLLCEPGTVLLFAFMEFPFVVCVSVGFQVPCSASQMNSARQPMNDDTQVREKLQKESIMAVTMVKI